MAQIVVDLIAKTGTFDTDIKRSARQAKGAFDEIEKAGKALGAALGTGLAVAGASLFALTKQSIDAAGALAEMSQKVGVSVESLSTLKFAAEQSGVSVEQLQGGLVKLAKNASDASQGIGTAVDGFDALGISVKNADGSLKNTDVLLREIATQFAKYEDGANKTALAVNLFGRAGAELIPLLNEGADGIEELEARARELGLELDTNTARAAEEFGDNLDQLKSLATGLGNDIARDLLPVLNDIVTRMTDSGVAARQGAGSFSFLADAMSVAASAAATFKNLIEAQVNVMAGAAHVAIALARAQINGLGEAAKALVAYQNALLSGDLSGAYDALVRGTEAVSDVATRAEEEITVAWDSMKDGVITSAVEIGRAWSDVERRTVSAVKVSKEAIASLAPSAAKLSGAFDALSSAQGFGGLSKALRLGVEGGREFAKTLAELTGAAKDAAPAIRSLAKEQDAAAKAAEEAAKAAEKQRKALQDLAVAGVLRLVDELDDLEKEWAQLDRRFAEQERDIKNEIGLLGLSTLAREKAIIALEAERLARDDNGVVIEEQRKRYEALLTTLADGQRIEAAAREFESIWMRGIENVADALSDGLVNGFEDGADRLIDVAKQLVQDLIRQFAQQTIVIPMQARMQGATGNFGNFGPMVNGQYAGNNTAFGASMFGDAAGQWFGGQTGMGMAGGIMGAAAGIYQVYDLSRNGPGGWDGAAQGAMSGAAAGTAIMPGIGTIIGAVAGLLIGYFGGGEPTIRVADREQDAQARSRLDDVIGVARDRMPEGTATAFANAIAQFDNLIAGIFDSYSGGAEQMETVRAALANWSIRVEGDAATIENVLEQRFGDIMETFTQEVRDFVMEGTNLEEQIDRLGQALVWPDQINAVLDQFRRAEMLGEMTELERATFLVNEQFDGLREQLEAMRASEAELTELERFRNIALQEAADAIAGNTEAIEQNAEAMQAALASYEDFVGQFDSTGSPFQRAMRDLRRTFEANTAQANELARAAGFKGARLQDLERIEMAYLREREAAIAGLTQTIVQQIADLYGSGTLESQIAALDEQIASLFSGDSGFGFIQESFREMALQAERSGLVAQLEQQRAAEEALRRQMGALDLAQNLADLSLARDIDFETLAAELGLDLGRFGADIGITADAVGDFIRALEADSLTADVLTRETDRVVEAIERLAEKPGRFEDMPGWDDEAKAGREDEVVVLLRSIDARLTALESIDRSGQETALATATQAQLAGLAQLRGEAAAPMVMPKRERA